MRARIAPPYPSFTYVMSQIDDSPDERRAGPQPHGDASLKSVPRPYSKYDDNPFMVRMHLLISVHGLNNTQRTVRYNYDECARSSASAVSVCPWGHLIAVIDHYLPSFQPTIHSSRGHPSLYPLRSKPSMSLPLVGKFLQVSFTASTIGIHPHDELQKHTSALSQRRKISSAI